MNGWHADLKNLPTVRLAFKILGKIAYGVFAGFLKGKSGELRVASIIDLGDEFLVCAICFGEVNIAGYSKLVCTPLLSSDELSFSMITDFKLECSSDCYRIANLGMRWISEELRKLPTASLD